MTGTNCRTRLRKLARKLQTEHPEGLSTKELFLASEDLLPAAPYKRTWTGWSYISFWIADAFNINSFSISASMIALRLTWWQAWICVWIGYGLAGPFLVLNGRPGAVFHLTFPAVSRTTFGVFGSLWVVLNRAFMAIIWWSVQAWLGGQCVYIAIRAMSLDFPNMRNTFGPDAGLTSAQFIGFFVFWLLSLPTLWLPLHRVQILFQIKAAVAPVAAFSYFGWTVAKAGGLGPIMSAPSSLSGSSLAWTMVISIMSCMGNMATLITNSSDFSSRARTPSAAVWPQLIALPAGFIVTSLIGILIASASVPLYGELEWDVLELLNRFLDGSPSGSTRFGVFFIAAAFVYVQLILNLAANSISAGVDSTALLPQWINIRRGSYLCACIGLMICPWNFFKSSNTFTNYLGAYSVFLSAIAGCMLCDYLFVRRGHYRIADLYKAEKGTWYYYNAGIHWRGFVAYLCGVAINLPGFIKEFVPSLPMSIAATRLYQLSWFTGVVTSGSVYFILCCVSPPPGMNRHWEEVDESNYEDNTSIDHFDEPAGVPSEERSSADLEKEAFNESEKRQTSVKVLAA